MYLGVKAVKQLGRRLGYVSDPSSFNSIQAIVSSDEVPVMLLNNGVTTIAPVLTSQRDHESFWGSYYSGRFVDYAYVALKRTDIPNCPDEGHLREFGGIKF